MKKLLLFLFGFFSLLTNAQGNFPNDYFGNYIGTLQIQSEKGNRELPMELHFQPTDSTEIYHYTIVYGEGDQRQERKYFLKAEDASKGKYIIDEDNGIILQVTQMGNQLYSLFEVNGSLLTTFITFEEDHLIFEITVATRENKEVTYATEDQTEVIAYPIGIRQKAVLIKQ